jgi:hypothetical protein
MDELKRILSLGRCYGIEIHEISATEAGAMWPMMRSDDLEGGIYPGFPISSCLDLATHYPRREPWEYHSPTPSTIQSSSQRHLSAS